MGFFDRIRDGLAQQLITNDCQAQLDVLIDTFTSPTAS